VTVNSWALEIILLSYKDKLHKLNRRANLRTAAHHCA